VGNAILYAVLGALVGIAVVAVSGGGISRPRPAMGGRRGQVRRGKLRIAGAVRSAPALPGQARQYAGDRGRPYDDGAPAPGTVARPHVERPDDRRY
jgi:hypothetical protein